MPTARAESPAAGPTEPATGGGRARTHRPRPPIKNPSPKYLLQRQFQTYDVEAVPEPPNTSAGSGTEARSADGARGLFVTAEESTAEVAPGGQTACHLQIRNTGSTVERFDLKVEGLPAHWATAEPATINLNDGASEGVTIRIHPPADASASAGVHRALIRVWCPNDLTVRAEHPVALTIHSFDHLELSFEPATTSGRGPVTTTAVVRNSGNHAVTGSVETAEPTGSLRIHANPPTVTVAPGTEARVQLDLRPRQRRWTGRSAEYRFQVSVSSGTGGVAGSGSTSFVQMPIVPQWAARAALLALPLLLVAGGLWGKGWWDTRPRSVPFLIGKDAGDAERELTNKGFVLGSTDRVPDESAPEGQVVSQRPRADESARGRTDVDLMISAGPPEVELPRFVGRTLADTESNLERLGLVVDRVEVENEELPGLVLETDPEAGERLAAGSTVRVTVSAGPGVVDVPSLVRLLEPAAQDRLTELGLSAQPEFEPTTEDLVDRVIRTDPGAGAQVQPGDSVVIVIGVAAPTTTTPLILPGG